MIQIEITAAAYAAIANGCDSPLPAQPSPLGGFYLWLAKDLLERLTAARGPGESYSGRYSEAGQAMSDEFTARGMRLAETYLEVKRLREQNRRLRLAVLALLIVGTVQWALQFLR